MNRYFVEKVLSNILFDEHIKRVSTINFSSHGRRFFGNNTTSPFSSNTGEFISDRGAEMNFSATGDVGEQLIPLKSISIETLNNH